MDQVQNPKQNLMFLGLDAIDENDNEIEEVTLATEEPAILNNQDDFLFEEGETLLADEG